MLPANMAPSRIKPLPESAGGWRSAASIHPSVRSAVILLHHINISTFTLDSLLSCPVGLCLMVAFVFQSEGKVSLSDQWFSLIGRTVVYFDII